MALSRQASAVSLVKPDPLDAAGVATSRHLAKFIIESTFPASEDDPPAPAKYLQITI